MRLHHAMIRVKDLEKSLWFWCDILGFKKRSSKDSDAGRYTLVFLKHDSSDLEIELTYNWDQKEEYTNGRNFGHFAFIVEDIYQFCTKLQDHDIFINRPPIDGRMAFIKDPDGISIELLQSGEPLPIKEPWASMEKVGTW
jgi:lactoylglutathione lyase